MILLTFHSPFGEMVGETTQSVPISLARRRAEQYAKERPGRVVIVWHNGVPVESWHYPLEACGV